MALRDRQKELFCQIYTSNGLRVGPAALECGLDALRASRIASDWLKEPVVAARIDELIRPLLTEHRITRERIIQEYARLAFYDVRRMYGEDGRLMSISDMDEDTAAAICSITTKGIRLADKKGALDALAKIFKVIVDEKVDNNVTVNIVRSSATEEDML